MTCDIIYCPKCKKWFNSYERCPENGIICDACGKLLGSPEKLVSGAECVDCKKLKPLKQMEFAGFTGDRRSEYRCKGDKKHNYGKMSSLMQNDIMNIIKKELPRLEALLEIKKYFEKFGVLNFDKCSTITTISGFGRPDINIKYVDFKFKNKKIKKAFMDFAWGDGPNPIVAGKEKILTRVKKFLSNGETCSECKGSRGECACGENLLELLYDEVKDGK